MMQVTHVSSTFYGGGVTKNLTPLTLMMNATEAAARIVQVLKLTPARGAGLASPGNGT